MIEEDQHRRSIFLCDLDNEIYDKTIIYIGGKLGIKANQQEMQKSCQTKHSRDAKNMTQESSLPAGEWRGELSSSLKKLTHSLKFPN